MKLDKDVLDKVHKWQERNYIYYIKPTDTPFKIHKWIYYVLFIYNIGFTALSIVSYYFRNFVAVTAGSHEAELIATITISLITLTVLALLFIIGFIFTVKKFFLTGLIINNISIIGLLLSFFRVMTDYIDVSGFLNYFVRHGIPLLLCLIFANIVGILGFRAYLKDKKAYIEYTDKDYTPQFKD